MPDNNPHKTELPTPDWAALRAACLADDVDPNWFNSDFEHDDYEPKPTPDQVKEAEDKALVVCDSCPRRCVQACLDYHMSMSKNKDYGVRGGKRKRERDLLREKAG